MAKAFKYGLKGIKGHLEPAERELLRSLFDDVISMLEPEQRANEDPLAALVGLDTEAREPKQFFGNDRVSVDALLADLRRAVPGGSAGAIRDLTRPA